MSEECQHKPDWSTVERGGPITTKSGKKISTIIKRWQATCLLCGKPFTIKVGSPNEDRERSAVGERDDPSRAR